MRGDVNVIAVVLEKGIEGGNMKREAGKVRRLRKYLRLKVIIQSKTKGGTMYRNVSGAFFRNNR